jgi:very-short-patch-repair endonuclease
MTRVDAATAARLYPRSGIAAAKKPPAYARPPALGSDGERAFETQLRQVGITGAVRELQFDAGRGWRFDFAWLEELVAVEIEGGTWAAGRHNRGAGFQADCIKYAEAAIRGWLVLRVTTEMVETGQAIQLLTRALWAASQRRGR